MQANFTLSTKSEFLPMGMLEELQSLGGSFEQARGLPGTLLALSCPIPEEQKHLLEGQGGKSNLGFGLVNLADGSKLHTIRFQMGGLLFYWVADMVDPEVWAAIDMWRSVGRMPLLFRIENGACWDAQFGVISGPAGALRNEAFRNDATPEPSAWVVAQMLRLVASGILREQATTDIPGVPLRHVFVNHGYETGPAIHRRIHDCGGRRKEKNLSASQMRSPEQGAASCSFSAPDLAERHISDKVWPRYEPASIYTRRNTAIAAFNAGACSSSDSATAACSASAAFC